MATWAYDSKKSSCTGVVCKGKVRAFFLLDSIGKAPKSAAQVISEAT